MRHPRAKLQSINPAFQESTRQGRYYQRVLSADDIPAMVLLQERCGAENVVPRDITFYQAHFADRHSAIGIIDQRGALVAHALVKTTPETTTMLNVLVNPDHRGQKLHGKMIDLWLENAAEMGIKTASARVRFTAVASYKNFEAAGMKSIRTEPSPEAPYEMTHVMMVAVTKAHKKDLQLV